MNSLNEGGLDFSVAHESLKATLLTSFLSVWVLIGIFVYLNYYTKRRYFSIWTAGWLFYVLWLTLSMIAARGAENPILTMTKQWSLAAVAVFLMWGSIRFLGLAVRQSVLALFLVFLFVWSYVGVYHLGNPMEVQIPLFALIGLASVLTGCIFIPFRKKRGYVGATLLALGFFLWGAYVCAYPFIASSELVTAGFFISAVLQLFIGVSMIVLVLEEVRSTSQTAISKMRTIRTEKFQLRAKIASTEERYRSLFDQASEAIIIVAGNDLHLLELNETAARMLGIKRSDIHDQFLPAFCQLNQVNGAPPKDSAEWVQQICQQRRLNLIQKNGAAVLSEVDGAPVDYEGQPAYQFFFREVTERTRLEQQLRQSEKLSALGQMISGVAHELNNPLAVVKGYLDLILTHHDLSSQTRSDLDKVSRECNRAIKLAMNFLAFSRDQPAHREMVSLNELIQRVSELRRFEINSAQVKLVLKLAPDLPLTCADPDQIQQLIINIVNNSLQAMAHHPQPRTLKITTEVTAQGLLMIKIEDSGPGVPPDLEARIFEPFFTTKAVGTGTGLGLSIAHSIMSDHRGRIFYQTSSLGGAGFVLEIPVVTVASDAPVPQENLPQKPQAQKNKAANILVVDDEQAIAELLCEMLNVIGHHPVLCLNPTEALEWIKKREFDLILSDFRMPVMNGEQFYHKVKESNPALAARMIFLTGDVVNDETQGFLQSTGNPHLGKPFQLAKVEEAVNEILSKKAAQAAPVFASPAH